MILDALAELADAQESTLSVASTDIIDTVAKGDSYAGAWFVVRVDTAFAAGAGAPSVNFQIQTSTTEAFSTIITLAQSSELLVAALTAGTFVKIRIPPGAKRYIRGYKSVSNYNGASIFHNAGKWDMSIVADTEIPVESPAVLA